MSEEKIHHITHAIIANQIALNKNEAVKHTPYYKQGLKQKLNLLMPELIKAEKDYDDFFEAKENSTVAVYEAYEKFINAVASVPIWECENITAIIQAYRKDPKSIEGIVNKILRS